MPTDRMFETTAELFGLLSASMRLKLLCELMQGECNVGQLVERVGTTQPNLSQHLSVLYRSGVVKRRRAGAQVFYSMAEGPARRVCQVVLNELQSLQPSDQKS